MLPGVAEEDAAAAGTGEEERTEVAVDAKRPNGEAGLRRPAADLGEPESGGGDVEGRAERRAC